MDPFIFISHSTEDRQVASEICQVLHSEFINTWISFQDIPVGSEWDRAAEKALEKAAAVIVVLSKSSAKSSYVRAEVERALQLKKKVVPIKIEEVDIPMRWQIIQYFDWTATDRDRQIDRLIGALPPIAMRLFRSYLENQDDFENLRGLLFRYKKWLPIVFGTHERDIFEKNIHMSEGGIIDCFTARDDSGGPNGYIYYLGSPYEEPIKLTGEISPSLSQLFSYALKHVKTLSAPLPLSHSLAPLNVLGEGFLWRLDKHAKKEERKPIGYKYLTAYIIIGRRHHYEKWLREHRAKLINTWLEKAKVVSSWGISMDILSYDRILERNL